jgi:chromate transport protein ChrA
MLVATLTTKSPLFGFLGFAAFCLPSAILLVMLGIFMNHIVEDYGSVNVYLRLTVLGFKAAGGALLIRRASANLK